MNGRVHHRQIPRGAARLLCSLLGAAVNADEATFTAAAATGHPLATDVAVQVLREGGNAVDAAIAAAFALGVVEPHASGLGGGGFMVIQMNGEPAEVIDFRETAPAATTLATGPARPDLINDAAPNGALSVAIPGAAAGLWMAHERRGTLSWPTLIEPSVRLAREGFPLSEPSARLFTRERSSLTDAALIALLESGHAGATFRNPGLAETLAHLAAEGPDWFTTGPVAEELVSVVEENGGVITAEDLRDYRPEITAPLEFTYRGHRIITVGLPSAGAVIIGRSLRALESHAVAELSQSEALHLIASELRSSASAVRPWVGDRITMPDDLDLEQLLTPGDAPNLAGEPPFSTSTTHLSVIDSRGNAVALTQTINSLFGAKILLPNSGIILNNEMADFTFPGSPLWVEGGANHPTPGARPATSMAPMLVFNPEDELVAVLGSPGGARIPSTLAQILVNLLDHGMPAEEAVASPRLHAPPAGERRIELESSFSSEIQADLAARGWDVRGFPALDYRFGGVQLLVRDPASGLIQGAADPRREGTVDGVSDQI